MEIDPLIFRRHKARSERLEKVEAERDELEQERDDLAYKLECVTLNRDQILSAWKSGYPMWYFDSRGTTTGPDKQEYTPPEDRPDTDIYVPNPGEWIMGPDAKPGKVCAVTKDSLFGYNVYYVDADGRSRWGSHRNVKPLTVEEVEEWKAARPKIPWWKFWAKR